MLYLVDVAIGLQMVSLHWWVVCVSIVVIIPLCSFPVAGILVLFCSRLGIHASGLCFFSLLFHCWFAQYMIEVLGTWLSLLLGSRFLMLCQKLVHLAQGTMGQVIWVLRFCCTATFAGVSCFAFDV